MRKAHLRSEASDLRGRNICLSSHRQKCSWLLVCRDLKGIALQVFLTLKPFLDGGTKQWIFRIGFGSMDQVDVWCRVPMGLF